MARREMVGENVNVVRAEVESGKAKGLEKRTIFHQLLDPNATEGHVVPSAHDMIEEGVVMVGAASDTTGNALAVATFYTLYNPELLSALTDELEKAFPDPNSRLDYLTLEKLPYLTAVIKEGLRLSYGLPGRLPRIVPPSGATFNGYFLPPGTSVSMSAWQMHHDPRVWNSPSEFLPSRWLEGPEKARRLDKYLVSFSKGNRQCLGMQLAYCELYVTLGTFFRRFGHRVAVYKTRPEDFEFVDFFVPFWQGNTLRIVGKE